MEKITCQIAALKVVLEKATARGWIESIDDEYLLPNGTMVVHLFDRSHNKHWLHITPEGNAYFAPGALPCCGQSIF